MLKKSKIVIPVFSLLLLSSCSNKTYGTLILDPNGGTFESGSEVLTIKGVSGKEVPSNKIEIPTKDDVKFKGWFENNTGKGNPIKLIYPYLVTHRVYAGWASKVNITYYVGVDEYKVATGYQGEDYKLESYETDDSFYGWYYDKEFKTSCNILSFPDESISLYAKIEENPTISLHYSDTSVVDYKGKAGSKIEESFTIPSKTGYKFVGWYTESENQFYFDYMPGSSLDLYPKFLKEVNISFETNGGSSLASITGYETEPFVDKIPLATKANHYLEGWYIDSSFTTRFTFETYPSEDLILYAHWVIYPYLRFTYETGVTGPVYDDIYLAENSVISLLPIPEIEGKYFMGWYTFDGANYTLFTEKFMPSHNVILVGRFDDLRRVTIESVYKSTVLNSQPELLLLDTIDGEWWEENYIIPHGYVLQALYVNSIASENLITLPYNPLTDITIKVNLVKITNIEIFDGANKILTISGGEGMSYDINSYSEALNKPNKTIEGFYLDEEFNNAYAMKTFPSSEVDGKERLTLKVYIRYSDID